MHDFFMNHAHHICILMLVILTVGIWFGEWLGPRLRRAMSWAMAAPRRAAGWLVATFWTGDK